MANLPLRSLKLPNGNTYGVGGTYIVSSSEELEEVMRIALPGSVIQLKPGSYGQLDIHDINAYQENLTIQGTTNIDGLEEDIYNPKKSAIIEGVSITSSIQYSEIYTEGNCDITKAIFPKDLTFRNITFTDSFSLRNARIDDLTIKDCAFIGSNIYITPEGFNDSYGSDSNNAASYRRPYAHVGQKNLTISECKFIDAIGYQGMKENADGSITKTGTGSGIHILGVNGVTIYKNYINGKMLAEKSCGIHDGIQVGGYPGSAGKDPVDVYSSGEIKIIANTIDTIGSRAINISSVKNANITVSNNDCFNINKQDRSGIQPIRIQSSINTTVDFTINEPYHEEGFFNTWDKSEEEDKRITTENGGIKVQNITFPTTPSSLLRYSDDNKENESDLDKWLEGVFKDLPDYSYTDISIQCPGIRGSSHTMVGKLYKQSASGIVDVIEHLSGNHFTKTRDWSANNGAWNRTRFCPEQQIAGIYESIETLTETTNEIKEDMNMVVFTYDKAAEDNDIYIQIDAWLDLLLSQMQVNETKTVSISDRSLLGKGLPFSAIIGVLYKMNEDGAAQLLGTTEIDNYPIPVSREKNENGWQDFNYSTNVVISSGSYSDNKWFFRKWSNGDYECWGIPTAPSGVFETITQNIHMAREVIINIPQDFTDIYTANVNIRKPGNGVAGVFNSSPSARNAKITTYIIRIAGGTDSLNIDFDVYIRGRWK